MSRPLSSAEIAALPPAERFVAILELLTPAERELLASAADKINALPADQQAELAVQFAAFAYQRTKN